jgi:hypothetical protein
MRMAEIESGTISHKDKMFKLLKKRVRVRTRAMRLAWRSDMKRDGLLTVKTADFKACQTRVQEKVTVPKSDMKKAHKSAVEAVWGATVVISEKSSALLMTPKAIIKKIRVGCLFIV